MLKSLGGYYNEQSEKPSPLASEAEAEGEVIVMANALTLAVVFGKVGR